MGYDKPRFHLKPLTINCIRITALNWSETCTVTFTVCVQISLRATLTTQSEAVQRYFWATIGNRRIIVGTMM